jgi:phage terminase large subunit
MPIKLTKKQAAAAKIIRDFPSDRTTNFLMYGGSQSAKTSFACMYIQTQCLQHANITALICRKHFTDLKATIFQNTFYKMMELQFGEGINENPNIVTYIKSSPLSATFFNGSVVYFLGLDDTNSSADKVLGRYASIFLLDECSEIGYQTFAKLQTRLNVKSKAKRVGLCTMNPTTIFGWPYKIFIEKRHPIDDVPLKNPELFSWLQMNPADNIENLPEGYLENLENLSAHDRERFLHGNFLMTAEGAVYEESLQTCIREKRVTDLGKFNFNYPISVALDIGWDDFSSAWIFQVLPDYICFYDYCEENKIELAKFVAKLEKIVETKKTNLHKQSQETVNFILPHDASHKWVGSGLSVKEVLGLYASKTPERPKSFKVLAIRGIYEGINACRLLFPKCKFDSKGCEIGLRRLGQYREYLQEGNDEFKKKVRHDMASHAADAFRYAIGSFYVQQPYKEDFGGNK